MKSNDPEYLAVVPVIYEIVYVMMFQIYSKHRDPGMQEEDPHFYLPNPKQFEAFTTLMTETFNEQLFQQQSRLPKDKLVTRLSIHKYQLLQPHRLRHQAYYKFMHQ